MVFYHITTCNIFNNYIYKLIYEYTIIAYYNNIRNIDTEVIGVMNNCPDGNIINNLLGNYKSVEFTEFLKKDITI